jgi:putative zinc finger protein
MSCPEVQDRLDDYVDGEVTERELHDIELHLEGCVACREEERELRRLLSLAAGLPRSVPPARNLWPEIAAGIQERKHRAGPAAIWWLGAAAAALFAIAFWLGPRGGRPDGAAAESPTAAVSSPEIVPAALRGTPVTEAEREYERATAELMAALEARRASLSPETLTRLQQNLRTIDDALVEIRQALATDSSNPQLNRLLASTHEKKVETLQRVLKLASL